MIPKVIHYCWFGQGKLNALHQRCIDSWRRLCPEYEIRLWNEGNSDLDNDYCRAAIARKKWAFVSDWVRFDVLYRHGGIYLDTDMELIRSLDPVTAQAHCVLARESATVVGTAFLASPAGDPVMAAARQLILADLGPRKLFTSSPLIVGHAAEQVGAGRSTLLDAKSFFPFNPYDHENPLNARQLMFADVTAETIGIHHYGPTVSWTNGRTKRGLHRLMQMAGLHPAWSISFDAFAGARG
ncbi:glycosyltransferase family 32 protein [Massilia sp. NR 4-1]|uniref:glycosyltransferase family 32 protein n=1 Tax=Massilia sp. NR 4-1 TaxID=1678028 RepID=UPI00067BB6C7|nr:glycosyltransferase [Massilia sp. NR 4-1]